MDHARRAERIVLVAELHPVALDALGEVACVDQRVRLRMVEDIDRIRLVEISLHRIAVLIGE